MTVLIKMKEFPKFLDLMTLDLNFMALSGTPFAPTQFGIQFDLFENWLLLKSNYF